MQYRLYEYQRGGDSPEGNFFVVRIGDQFYFLRDGELRQRYTGYRENLTLTEHMVEIDDKNLPTVDDVEEHPLWKAGYQAAVEDMKISLGAVSEGLMRNA